eukprot:TRINITY_DN109103_c0_g1_i1.p1 TRINITY_DN109103_c0_g1~~TRINITY_DN109103_c0_g1_i1.p1  ORF type:complete len:255 (-),score=45.22 TRINITY_DN109103_c0_g1_i1:484-1212(-)
MSENTLGPKLRWRGGRRPSQLTGVLGLSVALTVSVLYRGRNFLLPPTGADAAARSAATPLEATGRRWFVLSSGVAAVATNSLESMEAAKAQAMDYRTIDKIDLDPSKRRIVGDIGSEKAQKAIKLLEEELAKLTALKEKYKYEQVDIDILTPFNTPVEKIRESLNVVYDLFDKDSRRDLERVGRLALTARYRVTNSNPVWALQNRGYQQQVFSKSVPKNQEEIYEGLKEYIVCAGQLLAYLK